MFPALTLKTRVARLALAVALSLSAMAAVSDKAFAAQARAPQAPPLAGKGARDFSGYWMPLRTTEYAAYTISPEYPAYYVLHAGVKDNGKLVEKIDDMFEPAAAAARKRFVQLNDIDGEFQQTPLASCAPSNLPGEYDEYRFGWEWLQTPTMLLAHGQNGQIGRAPRITYIGQPPKDQPASWLGQSIGNWEGDTLAVVTTGVNGKGTMFPAVRVTPKARIEARYRLLGADFSVLEGQFTYDDPGVTKGPIKYTRLFARRPLPDDQQEAVCNQYNREAMGIHSASAQ